MNANGKNVGSIGLLTSKAKRLANIKNTQIVLFIINIDALEPLLSRDNHYIPLPEYPEVNFDISLLFPNSIKWQEIVNTLKDVHSYVKSVIFIDEYRGKGVPENRKSITLRLCLGTTSRTLASSEVKQVIQVVIEALEQNFDVQQR